MHTARHFWKLDVEDALSRFATGPRKLPPWRDNDRPLYLYGAGNLGKIASEFLAYVEYREVMTFDRKVMLEDHVIDPEIQIAVSIITSPYVLIERSLKDLGAEHIVPFYDLAATFSGKHPLADNGWSAGPLTKSDQDGVRFVYDRWEDDRSRAHHLQFIAWRRIREEWTFAKAPVSNEDRYFIPEVVAALHDHKLEVFLDGGAHHGETSVRFLDIVGEARIIAVEPDEKSFGRLHDEWRTDAGWTAESSFSVVRQPLPFALGAVNGIGSLHGGFGYASRLGENGNVAVQVRTIDSLDIDPTFIKLHLEGGELDALRGAKETLIKHRPVVAATAYHNDDGIYRTAEWLMETLENYRFLFRNHCWQGAGAVVYAIPCERKR